MGLLSAAATAAVIYKYGKAAAAVGVAAGTSGKAIWALFGLNKERCPVCHELVTQRDSEKHATEHTFDCPTCHEKVPFSDLEKHAENHGFRCSVCYEAVPLAAFGTHLDLHRLEDLEREYQLKMADLDRAEAAYMHKREQAILLWEHLKSNCPVCRVPVPMTQMESHVQQHTLDLKPGSDRRNELASMGIRVKGLKIGALVKRWVRRQ